MKEAVKSGEIRKLTPKEKAVHSAPYRDPKLRNQLIAEWEVQTGQTWPTYTEPVYSKKGKLLKNVGDRHDAHHTLPQEYAGPHVWWNGHPVHSSVHQGGVHGKKSQLRKLMKKGE